MPFVNFENPWGLLGLLALPTIVAIHMFHRRFPRLVVAGIHLWAPETQIPVAGRRPERLPITKSLLLELAAALCLSLAWAQPRIDRWDKVTHLIVVLDNSASMQGTPAGESSFRDAAVAELKRRLGKRERRTVVTCILSGRRPVMLAGPAVPANVAIEKLADWKPTLPRHQFAPAWDLACQLASDSGELLFLTDQIPDSRELPPNMEVVSVGKPTDNVALAAARWDFDSVTARGTVYARLQNNGSREAAVEVRGYAAERIVFRQPMKIAPGEASAVEVQVPGGLKMLRIEITSDSDGLALDNSAVLVEPKVRTVKVADALPNGPARDAIERVLTAVPDVGSTDQDVAELLIAPAADLPQSNAAKWWLGVGPLNPNESERQEAQDLIGPYLLDKRNPLLQGVGLGGVVWGGVQQAPRAGIPLIAAGSIALLSQLSGTRTTAYLINIDMARSNLAESPDWPILIDNLIEMRRERLPGLRRWNYRLGEEISFGLFEGEDPSPQAALSLVREKRVRPLERSALVDLPLLDETGLYEVREGDALWGQFAVNFFDPEESNLHKLAPGNRVIQVETGPSKFTLHDPYTWIVLVSTLLILSAVLGDWYVLRPQPQRHA